MGWFNFSSSFRQDDEEEAIEFYLRLCFDVLFEVFRFGCRRKLTKLERVGHRLHWLIEKYFPDAPFLRLDLELNPRFVFVFVSIHWWDHTKKIKKAQNWLTNVKTFWVSFLLIIKSIIHPLYTHCRSQECQVLRPPPRQKKTCFWTKKFKIFSCCVD